MTTAAAPRIVATTVTANTTATAGKHLPVDATSGALTITLPAASTANAGGHLSIEKRDSSVNAVTITGPIRGATSTITLTSQFESMEFTADPNGSWVPVAGHKTKSALDSLYATPLDVPNIGRGLKQVQNKVALINAGIPARVKICTYGDSYAQKIYSQLITGGTTGGEGALKRIYGAVAGGYGRDSSMSGPGAGGPTSGTYTSSTTAWDASPDGIAYTLTAGQTMTFPACTADTIKAYVIAEPSAGTYKLQLNGVDVTGYTSLSAAGALGNLAISTLTGLSTGATQQLTIVGVSGTVRVLTWGWENTSVSGLVAMNISQGGIALNSPSTTAWSNWTALLADIAPDVMTYEAKESSTWYAAALTTFFTATKTGAPRMDVIGIGSPPVVNDTTSDQSAQNAQLKAACLASRYIYYDTYRLFQAGATPNGVADYNLLAAIGATTVTASTTSGNTTLTVTSGSPFPLAGASLTGSGIPAGTFVSTVNPTAGTLVMTNAATATATGVTVTAGGWNGDGTHILPQADQYRARALFQDLFLPTAFGRPYPFDVNGQSLSATVKMLLGKTPGAPVLELDADLASDQDVYAYLKRALRFRLPGSSTDLFILDSRNNTGNPSVLPAASQFGAAAAGVYGEGASTLAVRALSGGNLNSYGSLKLLAFQRIVVSANVSGTYQVPVLTGSIFRLTPTVDGTTISAANGVAITDGQEIIVQVKRGATPHTYTMDSHFNFPGGVAPTPGTTAVRQDIYTFIYDGAWRCTSSQIDVPA